MSKFILAIVLAIVAANFLANTIEISPTAGSALDRANTIHSATE